MLRLLLLGFLIYSIGTGLNQGWLVVKWSLLLHNIGFTSLDPEKPMKWKEFILDRIDTEKSSLD
tara:strand:- start:38 stop:229 length:192 start_codon:yes stop_codon:yes gene_type:complete